MTFKEQLTREMGVWTEKEIITEAQAAKIAALYPEGKKAGAGVLMIVFGVIGALLIGGGVILIFARNWSELPVWFRTGLAFLPLAVSWGIAGRLTVRHVESAAWREGCGAFNAMAVYACVALIGQIYQLPGDFSGFLLLCSLLIIPAAYCLRATVPILIYIVGVTVWAVGDTGGAAGYTVLAYIGLLALAAPRVWARLRRGAYDPFAQLLLWCLGICGFVVSLTKLPFSSQIFWVVSLYFSALYLVSVQWFGNDAPLLLQPLKVIGGLGGIVMLFIMTNGFAGYFLMGTFKVSLAVLAVNWPQTAVSGLLAAGCLALLFLNAKGGKPRRAAQTLLIGGVFLFVALLEWVLPNGGTPMYSIDYIEWPYLIVTNAYVIAVGALLIVNGLADMRFSSACVGTVVVSVIILIRFFDTSYDFLFRGIAFIAVGAMLLASNVFISRRIRKGAAADVAND